MNESIKDPSPYVLQSCTEFLVNFETKLSTLQVYNINIVTRFKVKIIIIIIIIIIFSSLLQGIYTYIPETNHVPREYTVAAILSLLFMVPISPVPTLALCTFTLALSEVCVQCPI
jgi:hypothetical protein